MLYHSGNQLWHSDSSFKPVPAHSSLLSARVIPPAGGETEFASMRVAYDALPEDLRRQVDGKIVVHSFGFSRSLIDPGIGSEIGRDICRAPPARAGESRQWAEERSMSAPTPGSSRAWQIEDGRILIAQLLEIPRAPTGSTATPGASATS